MLPHSEFLMFTLISRVLGPGLGLGFKAQFLVNITALTLNDLRQPDSLSRVKDHLLLIRYCYVSEADQYY